MTKKLEIKDIMERGYLITNKEEAIDLINKVLKKHWENLPLSVSYLLVDIKRWLESEKRIINNFREVLIKELKYLDTLGNEKESEIDPYETNNEMINILKQIKGENNEK